jgi:deoxyribonuclease V
MKFKSLHPWNLSAKEAIVLQRQLAEQVVLANSLPAPIRTVAGVDVSYKRRGRLFHAAVVVLDYATQQRRDAATATGEVNFPYVPGLLSFRELPILLQAFEKLATVPDVVLADGQGIAHPRRLGLASHLGLWLDLPTIGCAKTRLCGEELPPAEERGQWTALRQDGEEIGRIVRTRSRVKPLYVSPGHKVDMSSAMTVVLQCGRGYRLPEPTRQAHLLSNATRRTYAEKDDAPETNRS